ncbi:MAG: S8 family peptidase [Lachnospiraceae bacterium]|nr:S8 family peptidase [Lachnospiraceae bacterium]
MECKERILSEDYLDLIADYDVMLSYGQQEGADFCYQQIDDELYIVYGSEREIGGYGINTEYESIPKCYGLMDIAGAQLEGDFQEFNFQPLISTGILEVNNSPLSLTGKGVILAFIDTGIRYDLDVFRWEDGSSRILAIWDQTIQTGTPPEGLFYGTEFTSEQINEALAVGNPYDILPSRDEIGHGTKMASVAAGSIVNNGFLFRGAAPDASIVVVKLKEAKQTIKDYFAIPPEAVCYSESDIIMALKYVQSFYQVFESPIVICFGLGSTMGDHAGNSYFANYLDRIARRRNIGLVICGGNEGNSASHFTGQVPSIGIDSYEDVEIKVGENEFGFSAFLWGEIPNIFTVEIRSPDGEVIPRINYRLGQAATYRFLYSSTIVHVEYVLIEQTSGQQLIFFKFEKPLSGIWTIRVYATTDGSEARFNMWLPIEGFLRSDTYFLSPNPYITLTEPAYVQSAITVSTYNSANNSFYLRSGRGFGRTGSIVPDMAAPGVDVSTILGSDSGSSLSAALTAGAVADFFEWAITERNDPTVNSVTTNNYFIRGAIRERGIEYPSREWGYGRLDLAGLFRALIP